MTTHRGAAVPLSPALLAGLAARPLPLGPLQPLLTLAVRAMAGCHPGVFERLAELGNARFLVVPTDLPFAFELAATSPHPRLRAVRPKHAGGATATIRGPIAVLIALLEGRIDGDALFFGRDLVIEGDTEAVLALRNAVDGAEIDIVADLTAELGPLRGPARHAAGILSRVHGAMAADLEMLRRALVGRAEERIDALAARVAAPDTGARQRASVPSQATAGPVS